MDDNNPPRLLNSPQFWRQVGFDAIVAFVFAALTFLVTYPVTTQIGSSLAQHPEWTHDAFHHAYVLWWFKKALLDLHISPADLRLINFPTGGYYPLLLTYSTVYLTGIPFLLFFSPTATYNILFLLSFFLSGLSGYALCAYLTRNRWAGLLGGIVYAFFPNRMAHALSGHLELISTYLFPLYLLLLIKSVRKPRPTTTFFCGLALAASLLIQPLFVLFLLVPVTLVWLLYERLVVHRPIRPLLVSLAGAFGGATLIAAPFYWPALKEQIAGQGDYLQAPGSVLFSADLLGYLSPSPFNPLFNLLSIVPPYAHNVLPTFRSMRESLVYVGVIPLLLGIIALYSRRRQVGAWGLIALGAAVLAMGPFLQINGRLVTITIENHKNALALPYALLMKLPLFSYNRAPARLNVTMMLAMSVISAYGLSQLLTHIRNSWRGIIAVTLCLLTLGEFLVMWPYPTTPVQFPQGSMLPSPPSSDQAKADRAVLHLPVDSWAATELAIFYQTVHERPIFGGWVQRSLSGTGGVEEFLDQLFAPSPEHDIVPTPSAHTRASIAQTLGVGYVLSFEQYMDDAEIRSELLSEVLGSPLFTKDRVALYQVPYISTDVKESAYVLLKDGWQQIETWDEQPARWMSERASFYLYASNEQEGAISFTVLPFAAPQRLQVKINDDTLPPVVIEEKMTYTTPSLHLQPGLNKISFRSLEGCTSFFGDPRCAGPAHSSGANCNPNIRWERCLSILFQNIRFSPTASGPAQYPLEITLDERIRFMGYDIGETPSSGEKLPITLHWQVLEDSDKPHIIFVHLLSQEGDLLAQYDAPPLRGLYPASEWIAGDTFSQKIVLTIPSDTSPGSYDLVAGIYTYPDIKRLPVSGDHPYAQDNLIWLQRLDISNN